MHICVYTYKALDSIHPDYVYTHIDMYTMYTILCMCLCDVQCLMWSPEHDVWPGPGNFSSPKSWNKRLSTSFNWMSKPKRGQPRRHARRRDFTFCSSVSRMFLPLRMSAAFTAAIRSSSTSTDPSSP